jgi:hypothetical protein
MSITKGTGELPPAKPEDHRRVRGPVVMLEHGPEGTGSAWSADDNLAGWEAMVLAVRGDPQRYISGYRLMMLGPGQVPVNTGPIVDRRIPRPDCPLVLPTPICDPALRREGEIQ